MAQVGLLLNLKEHTVGLLENTKNLYTPTDLEVHKLKDGRYVVCDFARLFPPEYPDSSKKGKKKKNIFVTRMLMLCRSFFVQDVETRVSAYQLHTIKFRCDIQIR